MNLPLCARTGTTTKPA